MRRALPEGTLSLIRGLKESTVLSPGGKAGFMSAYCAPGQTSRRPQPSYTATRASVAAGMFDFGQSNNSGGRLADPVFSQLDSF